MHSSLKTANETQIKWDKDFISLLPYSVNSEFHSSANLESTKKSLPVFSPRLHLFAFTCINFSPTTLQWVMTMAPGTAPSLYLLPLPQTCSINTSTKPGQRARNRHCGTTTAHPDTTAAHPLGTTTAHPGTTAAHPDTTTAHPLGTRHTGQALGGP